MPTISLRLPLLIVLIPILYTTWVYQVNSLVPHPYLDEAFHIPQAQAYCAGQFEKWDPKITTPPGLYVISFLLVTIRRWFSSANACQVSDLRWMNAAIALLVLPRQLYDLENRLSRAHHSVHRFHIVANISLFPVLFFLSALYYTDLLSVSYVLQAYDYHLGSLRRGHGWKALYGVKMLVVGIMALLVRQTNVFWVAVFLGGLHTVHHVKSQSQSQRQRSAHRSEPIHDPPVRDAYLEDYIRTAFSLANAASRDIFSLLLSLWPYLAILALFALFILVNGGVVLGDKENHVASLHIPQMLYIWPYITFFSWPVMLPHVLRLLSRTGTITTASLRTTLPRPSVALPLTAAMALAVHFNTIIHPFTLADNRHYVFYVFRLLLRHPLTKYAVVPLYLLCAWAAITALGNSHPTGSGTGMKTKQEEEVEEAAAVAADHRPHRTITPPPEPIRVSFLLVFLTATALSIITAPLVEPRYLIIPWLIWRLHVQPPQPQIPSSLPTHPSPSSSSPSSPLQTLIDRILALDAPTWLSLETAWFLLVNLATCWIFLYRGFEWEAQPGRVQRFMW